MHSIEVELYSCNIRNHDPNFTMSTKLNRCDFLMILRAIVESSTLTDLNRSCIPHLIVRFDHYNFPLPFLFKNSLTGV